MSFGLVSIRSRLAFVGFRLFFLQDFIDLYMMFAGSSWNSAGFQWMFMNSWWIVVGFLWTFIVFFDGFYVDSCDFPRFLHFHLFCQVSAWPPRTPPECMIWHWFLLVSTLYLLPSVVICSRLLLFPAICCRLLAATICCHLLLSTTCCYATICRQLLLADAISRHAATCCLADQNLSRMHVLPGFPRFYIILKPTAARAYFSIEAWSPRTLQN